MNWDTMCSLNTQWMKWELGLNILWNSSNVMHRRFDFKFTQLKKKCVNDNILQRDKNVCINKREHFWCNVGFTCNLLGYDWLEDSNSSLNLHGWLRMRSTTLPLKRLRDLRKLEDHCTAVRYATWTWGWKLYLVCCLGLCVHAHTFNFQP
jgi:hypothetical protein